MKKRIIVLLFLSVLFASLVSCQVVEGIFKAGMAWGIILVVGVIGVIIYLISRAGRQ